MKYCHKHSNNRSRSQRKFAAVAKSIRDLTYSALPFLVVLAAFILLVFLRFFNLGFTPGETVETTAVTGDAASGGAATPEPTATPLPASDAKLRLIYTTDTHGQITGYDYQRQTEVVRGLNRISTMIQTARDEMGNRNFMTFDVGDNIMDYTTDYIYNQKPTAIQPIYKALATLGYDAITIGNHELDYGINYANLQLESSGLMSKVILSNITSKITGDYVFGKENKIIKKEVIDDNGNSRIVKVGLFGVTPPSMSVRTENTKNSLVAEDILTTAKREVAILKEKGADIIIALAHSGVGTENPSENAANVGYAMTKIDDLDVILGGHQHVYYPDEKYSYLPGIDRSTWITNGTRLMVMRDSARSLGIVDLKLRFDAEGKVRIQTSDYDIRHATKDIKPDTAISAFMNSWGKTITKNTTKKVGSIGEKRWTTYLATLETNPILQTVQNAQRTYAYQYITENAPQYADWPILCATRYGMYGNESGTEYGDVTGDITVGRIQDFARYHQYIYVYEITGAQLKEWMEWSASVYQQPYTSSSSQWEDSTISRYVREAGGNSLMSDDCVKNWTSMFRFGGVEYTIDPSAPPRYTLDGRRISGSKRIRSITYNGEEVTDEQQFVIASDQILAAIQNDATDGIYTHKIAAKKVLLQDVVSNYLKELSNLGTIDVTTRQNWKLALPGGYRFLLESGSGGDDIIAASKWYSRTYDSSDGYSYYECQVPYEDNTDTEGPSLSLASSSYETSDSPVTVRILANDISGIAEKRYILGTRPPISSDWDNPMLTNDVEGDSVTFEQNGIYTFYVRDTLGNVSTQSIAITNIDPAVLKKPTVKKVDNNDKLVKGTAQVGATVNVKIGQKTYSDKADVDGEYMVDIPVQLAGTKISVYVSDSKGRKSGNVNLFVKSVGPNRPSASAANNSYYITGKTNETSAKVYAVIDNTVYVSKKLGKNYYKNCKKYDKSKTIVKTSVSVKKSGAYSIKIPHKTPDTTIKVFTVDTLGRASAARSIKVKRVTYEPVSRYPTYSTEKRVYGRIKEGKKGYIRAYYSNGKLAGSGYSDSDGYFSIQVGRALKKEEIISITAAKTSDSKARSHPSKLEVEDIKDADTGEDLIVNKVTAADTVITGTTDYKNAQITIIAGSTVKTGSAKANGDFEISLGKKLKKGTKIFILSRSSHGYFMSMKTKTVTVAPPGKPVIDSAIRRTLKVHVLHKKNLTMRIRVDGRLYTDPSVRYVKSLKKYMYTFEVEDLDPGSKIVAIAKNAGGTTKSKPYYIPE